MTTVTVPLDAPVPRVHADELARRVFFVSEAILDFALVGGDDVTAVDLVVPDTADPAELARKLRLVVANDVLAQRPAVPHAVWSAATASPADVFDELTATGAAVPLGDGLVALGGPVLALTDYLDARILALVEEFQATEYRYPTLIATEAMRRCGYFESFPQLMMFVSRLHADVDVYRGFLADLAAGDDLGDRLRAGAATVEHCLPPTMCFHTYAQLADAPLASPSTVVTARGKSFRFESRYRRSLERLWDFTIREIVFLGPREFVLGSRSRLMERTFDLVTELGLGGRCEVATDPFFVNVDTADRVWSQRFLELKYELRMPLDAARDVAVCSFNFHEQFFGERFGITAATGGPVHTACAGFGLERFAYAFLCRHGVDPAGWPTAVRRAVGMSERVGARSAARASEQVIV
jgi:seryl-tRNA synthetase